MATSQHDPLEELYRRPGFMIRRVHQIAVSLFIEETGKLGVTNRQYGILFVLKHRPRVDQISVACFASDLLKRQPVGGTDCTIFVVMLREIVYIIHCWKLISDTRPTVPSVAPGFVFSFRCLRLSPAYTGDLALDSALAGDLSRPRIL
jgi:hypothetical protein